jgi:uncharacterized Zn finger protein
VHYVLGAALDKEPFLLFKLRGRTKQQVLGALRASRHASTESGDILAERLAAHVASTARVHPAVSLADLNADYYERGAMPLPSMQFSVAKPAVPGALLKQLGPPPVSAGADFSSNVVSAAVAAGDLARIWVLGPVDPEPVGASGDV